MRFKSAITRVPPVLQEMVLSAQQTAPFLHSPIRGVKQNDCGDKQWPIIPFCSQVSRTGVGGFGSVVP
jgi:hypothetical protein